MRHRYRVVLVALLAATACASDDTLEIKSSAVTAEVTELRSELIGTWVGAEDSIIAGEKVNAKFSPDGVVSFTDICAPSMGRWSVQSEGRIQIKLTRFAASACAGSARNIFASFDGATIERAADALVLKGTDLTGERTVLRLARA